MIWETQAFSFYTTTTATIDRASAGQALLGILSFLAGQGIVKYQGPAGEESRVISSEEDSSANSSDNSSNKAGDSEFIHD